MQRQNFHNFIHIGVIFNCTFKQNFFKILIIIFVIQKLLILISYIINFIFISDEAIINIREIDPDCFHFTVGL